MRNSTGRRRRDEVFLAEQLDGVGERLHRPWQPVRIGPMRPCMCPSHLRSQPHHDDGVDQHDHGEHDYADEDSEHAHRSISPITTSTEPDDGDDVADAAAP